MASSVSHSAALASLSCSPIPSTSPWQSRSFVSNSGRLDVIDKPVYGTQRCSKSSLKSSFCGNGEDLALKNFRRLDVAEYDGVIRSMEKPLKVMISGAPASGKGTQCELIVQKFALVHISAGDLLRAEVAAGTEYGNRAKEYMSLGKLVPSEIVGTMVKDRLLKPDVQRNGWLLDGYPRSLEQANGLEAVNVRPDLFILLDVPDKILVDRVTGRRQDPVTGKIYHVTFSPPETEEVTRRLTQRFDDTEEKVHMRLKTYHANLESVLGVYSDIIKRVDGNRPKMEVFADIERFLSDSQNKKSEEDALGGKLAFTSAQKYMWKGIPTKLNTIPHTREIRSYFYNDVCYATKKAIADGIHKLKVQITIPELNPEMDVYRIGTLLELVREIAFTFANDGQRVRVCVQGSMGEGIFSGIPLQLSGVRRMLELMDWGDYEAQGTFINIGAIGAKEVHEEDDVFVLLAPQNAVGNCIIDDLQAMVVAAGNRPLIIVNPRLKDIPSAGGVMQIQGREKRLEFTESFFVCYNFRLLYVSGTQYPIMGALRKAYPFPYEVHKRLDTESGKEEYSLLRTFEEEPSRQQLSEAFDGRTGAKDATLGGFWSFFSRVLN